MEHILQAAENPFLIALIGITFLIYITPKTFLFLADKLSEDDKEYNPKNDKRIKGVNPSSIKGGQRNGRTLWDNPQDSEHPRFI